MIDEIKKFFHFNIAHLLNLLVWSVFFAIYLLYDKYNGNIDRDILLTYIYLLTSIIFINYFIFIILRFVLLFFRYGETVAYLISNLLVTLTFIINNMTVLIYGRQLGYEGVVMAFRGWSGGEMGDFTFTVIKSLFFIGIYLVLFYSTCYFLNYILSGTHMNFNYSVIFISVIVMVTVIIHFRLVALADTNLNVSNLKNKIPWQSVTGFPEDRVKVEHVSLKGNSIPQFFTDPGFLDEKTELEQLRKLNTVKDRILSGDINARVPYNILFMNIEGLRSDMLNPENMPFLYRFASERGFILKKHYTTGNNTPGSLFGMLTGLAPYYFEPLRGNGFLNMSLQVLKKAGYYQSFYYNSPLQYEYIHRDIIEKTQDRFGRAPGTKNDDYGPREKILIAKYIADLRADRGRRRFDYYLMNVTHFNYFYPPECRKYVPDYNANFTKIGRASCRERVCNDV